MISCAQDRVADFDSMEKKIRAYLNVYEYNGEMKSFEVMEKAYENLFHEEFTHEMDGRPIDKDQMRETVKIFLSLGTKADLNLYRPLNNDTFEVKLHVVNRLNDLYAHSKGTIRDGKLIKLEAYEDAKPAYSNWHDLAELSEAKQGFKALVKLQNDKSTGLECMEDLFSRLFYDNLVQLVCQNELYHRGMRTASGTPADFSQARFSLELCEIMDDRHIEVKVRRDGGAKSEVYHDVLTVKDGAIVSIDSFGKVTKLDALLSSSLVIAQ